MKNINLLILSLALVLTLPTGAQNFAKHQVATGYNSWSAVSVDMDGDWDVDIVGSSRLTNRVSWWENDGTGRFILHPISANAAYAMAICAADMDSDGDMDVVCAVQEADAIIWWENNGKEVFTQHTLGNLISPSYITACDLDRDNDMDILVACCEEGSNRIVWCENIGDKRFSTRTIRTNWDHANSVSTADMDNDGDMDVIATVCQFHRIVLFKNNGDMTFTTVIVASGFNRPHCVVTADLDNDLDLDILGTSIDGNEIAWWENSLITGVDWEDKVTESTFCFLQNNPNPFAQTTSINFSLTTSSRVTVTIHDFAGKVIKTLLSKELQQGNHTFDWDGRNENGTTLSKGVYYCRLKTNDKECIIKVIKEG